MMLIEQYCCVKVSYTIKFYKYCVHQNLQQLKILLTNSLKYHVNVFGVSNKSPKSIKIISIIFKAWNGTVLEFEYKIRIFYYTLSGNDTQSYRMRTHRKICSQKPISQFTPKSILLGHKNQSWNWPVATGRLSPLTAHPSLFINPSRINSLSLSLSSSLPPFSAA